MRPLVSLIAALDEGRLIGREGRLPWHLSADLKRFRRLTTGHHVLMGRKTYESLGRPLPERTNVVITRDPRYTAAGCVVAHSLAEALAAAAGDSEIFVIGGAEIYAQMLPRADRLYLTVIHARFAGDAWFPDYPAGGWREIDREDHEAGPNNPYPYSFITLARARSGDTV